MISCRSCKGKYDKSYADYCFSCQDYNHYEPTESVKRKRSRIQKPKTNADRIRAMTDDELAELLDDIAESAYSEGYSKETDEPYMSPYPPTKSAWGNWLKQEAADKDCET